MEAINGLCFDRYGFGSHFFLALVALLMLVGPCALPVPQST